VRNCGSPYSGNSQVIALRQIRTQNRGPSRDARQLSASTTACTCSRTNRAAAAMRPTPATTPSYHAATPSYHPATTASYHASYHAACRINRSYDQEGGSAALRRPGAPRAVLSLGARSRGARPIAAALFSTG
jgi:hypothetical protein